MTIYDASGYAKNKLSTKNGEITFDNHYEGFPDSITGEFTCKYLTVIDGGVMLEMCTGPDSQEINRLFAFNFDEKEARKYNIHW